MKKIIEPRCSQSPVCTSVPLVCRLQSNPSALTLSPCHSYVHCWNYSMRSPPTDVLTANLHRTDPPCLAARSMDGTVIVVHPCSPSADHPTPCIIHTDTLTAPRTAGPEYESASPGLPARTALCRQDAATSEHLLAVLLDRIQRNVAYRQLLHAALPALPMYV